MKEKGARRRALRLVGLALWLALLLPIYALTVFGGLGLCAVGRKLIEWSDDVYRIAHVEDARHLIERKADRG